MKTKLYLITVLLLLYQTKSRAQPQVYLDSIENTIDTISNLLQASKDLNRLAILYANKDIEKSLALIKRAISIIPKEKIKEKGHLYNTRANLYAHQGNFEAFKTSIDSTILCYQAAAYEKGIGTVYSNLGAFYAQRDEYNLALSYAQKSLDIDQKNGQKEGVAHNLTTIVAINFAQEEYQKALENSKKALSYYDTANYTNIAAANVNIGLSHFKLNQYDSVMQYYSKAMHYYEKMDNKGGVAIIYQKIMEFYQETEDSQLALQYAKKALLLEDYINDLQQKIVFNNSLGLIYFANQKYQESITFHQKAEQLAQKVGIKKYEKDATEGLAKAYAALSDFKRAYQYGQEASSLKDSVLNEAKVKQLKELEIKYETEKKEKDNLLLEKKLAQETIAAQQSRFGIYALLGLLIFVISTAYLLLRANKAKALQVTTKVKHQLLRNQMNPHFIFNALIAIQSFMYTNELKNAAKYLSSFAKLIRAILENSRNEYITIDKEIQWLENYMKLQLLRFDNKFEYDIDIDSAIDTHSIVIPPMLVQPFIENSLEHGLKNIDYKGKVTIVFGQKNDILTIQVEDNGIGLAKSSTNKKADKDHQSLATKITKERLDYLNKNTKAPINFEIKPLESKGVLVSFSIPLKYI